MSKADEPTHGGAPHPTVEELLEVAEGTLPLAAEQRVRSHLETCSECDSLVRDLVLYPKLEPPEEAYRVDEAELRSSLGALRARFLELERENESGVVVDDPKKAEPTLDPANPRLESPLVPPKLWRRSRWDLGIAAAVVLLALAWGGQQWNTVRELRQEIVEIRSQQEAADKRPKELLTNIRVVQVVADGDPRRRLGATTLITGGQGTLVIVQAQEPLPVATYTVEIRRDDGEVELRLEDLQPETIGVSFLLTPEILKPGSYQLWLLQDDQEVHQEPVLFRVVE